MAGRWPRQDFLELAALPGAVPCARLHARQVLWEWGHGHLNDGAELAVSELVTNAVLASAELARAAVVGMWLLAHRARVLILVQDGSHGAPVRQDPGLAAESGRGLLLVEAVSSRWGWYPHPAGAGKIVWAELAADPSAAARPATDGSLRPDHPRS